MTEHDASSSPLIALRRPGAKPASVPDELARSTGPVDRVLVLSGGLLSTRDNNLFQVLRRQAAAVKASSGAWLDVQIKLLGLEEILILGSHRRSRAYRSAPYREAVDRFLGRAEGLDSPELTEVALITLLQKEGISFEVATFSEIASNATLREELLDKCGCVFASTTLIRDLSELDPLLRMLKRPDNRIVLGGALAGILIHSWPGHEAVDALAIGYGEMLVPALARWIRSDYRTLEAPPGGRLETKHGNKVLYSGVPASKNLDDLSTPDWSLAERTHGRRFPLVHYESVRGCPYRCGFCNYPYLFDDTKFRYKSAEKIADDWARYAAAGAEYISCLDSLFTMPKQRLEALCRLLIDRKIPIKWLCYARADDLADRDTVVLMKQAGCVEVQIGIESGDQGQLDHMNKRCTVDKNARALINCREVGITTAVTVILGYPGETASSIRNTLAFMKGSAPDFYFAAPFNARVEYVPILSAESREKYGIDLANDGRSPQPYWRHDSMCCSEVGGWYRWFNREMMSQRVSLHAGLFYNGILRFDHQDRDQLLDFQQAALEADRLLSRVFTPIHRWAEHRLRHDVDRQLGHRTLNCPPPEAPKGGRKAYSYSY
jgi:anaerobic magnesium-protoporphyrin IX monomethyl ester cyclase